MDGQIRHRIAPPPSDRLPSTSHVGELGSALAVGIILRHQGTARRWRLSDAGRAARRLMLKLASVIALTNQMAI